MFLSLFGPNIKKMEKEQDVESLIKIIRKRTELEVKWEVKASAIAALGRIRSAEAVDFLISLLKKWLPKSRAEVKQALINQGDFAFDALLSNIRDASCCQSIVEILGELKDERAITPIIAVMKKGEGSCLKSTMPDYDVYEKVPIDICAADALAKIGGERVTKALLEVLSSRPLKLYSKLSAHVAGILGRMGESRAVASLLEWLDSSAGDYPQVTKK